MSGFRTKKTVLTEGIGSYVNGVFVGGVRSVKQVLMTVQNAGDVRGELLPMSEGRHLSDYVKIYSSAVLKTSQDGQDQHPDIVVSNGFGYEVVGFDVFQSNVINHYRYYGVKLFKYTSNADWLDGVLKRP